MDYSSYGLSFAKLVVGARNNMRAVWVKVAQYCWATRLGLGFEVLGSGVYGSGSRGLGSRFRGFLAAFIGAGLRVNCFF